MEGGGLKQKKLRGVHRHVQLTGDENDGFRKYGFRPAGALRWVPNGDGNDELAPGKVTVFRCLM